MFSKKRSTTKNIMIDSSNIADLLRLSLQLTACTFFVIDFILFLLSNINNQTLGFYLKFNLDYNDIH